jgi:hypothetical protein
VDAAKDTFGQTTANPVATDGDSSAERRRKELTEIRIVIDSVHGAYLTAVLV